MNNIPLFPSQGGTATLILREIPHRKTAYILIQTADVKKLPTMIRECAGFCRGFGAETCFVCSRDPEIVIPGTPSYEILQMTAQKNTLPPPGAPVKLLPISPENDSIYQRIYNLCFAAVTGAITYDRGQIKRIYDAGHRGFLALSEDDTPMGMGELHGNELAAVALLPEYRGQGKDLTLSLLSHCEGPEVFLTVASDNIAARRLYEVLGFTVCGTESTWYHC